MKLTFWQLITHFVADLFHYDGKFLQSIKYLITKPGYLSLQWFKGKRVSYLDPFKFYIFGSAIFFFVLSIISNDLSRGSVVNVKVANDAFRYDSININNMHFRNIEEYKIHQDTIAVELKDSWIRTKFNERVFRFVEILKEKGTSAQDYFTNLFFNSIPYMLFVCLPILAGILKLLYIRNKQYYYSDHGIFTMHLVLMFFIILIVYQIVATLSFPGSGLILLGLNIYAIINVYKAFRTFYQQSKGKTILKNLLFYFLSFFAIVIVFVGGLLFLFFKI